MTLKELIRKRLISVDAVTTLLARYLDEPAVFNAQAPDDKQEGWGGKSQYPRICTIIDMQANEERSSVGTLTTVLYAERTSMLILQLEEAVKSCFRDLLVNSEDGGPYCFAWARTDPFLLEGTNVIGQEVAFDIMEYPGQETTDPDPILALSRFIKEIYSEALVLGIDRIAEFTEPSEKPVFYCRMVSMDKVNGHNMNTISWMSCRMAVHLLCPDKGLNLKMLAAIMQNISTAERIIMLDGSPMDVEALQMDKQADYLRQGQLYVTGRFGVLKYKKKPHSIVKNIITN